MKMKLIKVLIYYHNIMTEKLKSSVTIPVWVITLIIPLLIGFVYNIISSSNKQAVVIEQISSLNKRFDKMENLIITHISVSKQ